MFYVLDAYRYFVRYNDLFVCFFFILQFTFNYVTSLLHLTVYE